MGKARVKSIRKKAKNSKYSISKKKVTSSVKKGAKHLSIFQQHIRKNMATALLAGFAFIMALVWRDAIQQIVNDFLAYFSITGSTAQYKVIVAVLTTLICTVGIVYFSRWGEKK